MPYGQAAVVNEEGRTGKVSLSVNAKMKKEA
jgi:hypothetical protein